MREIKNVQGSQEIVQETEFNSDTVYVRTNILRVENENFTGWEYDEIQYTKDEYIAKVSNEKDALKEEVKTIQGALDFVIMSI